MRLVKIAVLYVLRAFGAFVLARWLTRRGLRILCWHGIAQDDEHRFRPSLFITPAALSSRLEWLKRKGFPIITLDDAVRDLEAGSLPPAATVLTFDDGWASWRNAAPIVRGYPVTGYVMTCYLDRPEPIFNLFAQYAYWRSGKERLATRLGTLSYPELWAEARKLSFDDRAGLLPDIAASAGVDLERIARDRRISLLSSAELRELGWDIQLHTHLHEWSADPAQIEREIKLNAAHLAPVARNPLAHFCYPAGEYYRENFPVLAALGIRSATTCERRFNYPGDNPLSLGRFLDDSSVPEIVFEAGMSGVFELVRRLRSRCFDRANRLGSSPTSIVNVQML
jgi:peptidoglycan/xylan/chitin deacetylase (PgdA/CDA1 family)